MLTLQPEIIPPDAFIPVAVRPNPFSFAQTYGLIRPGESVAEVVARYKYDGPVRSSVHVYIGADYIPQDIWHCVRFRPGAPPACINIVPQGGGGGRKNPIATVLSIALLFAAPAIGSFLAGQLGLAANATFFGISAARVLGGVVGLVGSMAINALAPPPKPRLPTSSGGSPAENPTLFVSGARNQIMKFGRVPRVLGKMRMMPVYAAAPYTEIVGSDQYLRLLFCCGYGPLEITDLKIGDTALADFHDVDVEIRQGYEADAPVTLYTNTPRELPLSINVTAAAGAQVQTTEVNTDRISIDITFPRGLCLFGGDGSKQAQNVQITVEYSPAGTGTWTTAGTIDVTAAQTSAVRENLSWDVTRGQYDVRLTRLTADSDSTQLFNESDWTALRSIQNSSPVNLKGMAIVALRIKATDQLNGVVDRFNCMVQSIVPDWTGTDWVEAPTSNPASLFRVVLQDKANRRPLSDARLKLAKLQSWWQDCHDAGREYNAIIGDGLSVQDVLSEIAACGRASPGQVDGKWFAIQDKPQTVTRQHFTPRNSWGFQWQVSYPEIPHAFRVQFVNRDTGYQPDERLVFDDGYSEFGEVPGTVAAEIYAPLQLNAGVTSPDQAWKDGRYHIASLRLRPATYSFNADMEHIGCTRGDLIKLTHDVVLAGLGYARIKAVTTSGGNVTGITVDDIFTMEPGRNYCIRVRSATGASTYAAVTTVASETKTLAVAAPFPLLDGDGDAVCAKGDLVMFGETGKEAIDLIVKSIEPAPGLTARITCVDAAPELHNAETGAIPPYNSQVSIPPEMRRPPAPVVAAVQTNASVMLRDAAGGLTPTITLTLAPPPFLRPLTAGVQIRRMGESAFHAANFTADAGKVVIVDVQQAEYYDILLLYRDGGGMYSPQITLSNILVEGTFGPPSNVENFRANTFGTTLYMSWRPVKDVDLSHYRIKYNSATDGSATWANSNDAFEEIQGTTAQAPARSGTYMIKAVDKDLNESLVEDAFISMIGALAGYDAVETVTEDPAFAGAMTDVVLDSGVLRLDDGVAEGIYVFAGDVDLGAIYTSTIEAHLDVYGLDLSSTIDDWGSIDAVSSWDGDADPAEWSVQMQLRSTNDDPAGAPVWSGWKNIIAINDETARAFQFRAVLKSFVTGITPAISGLAVTVNMPDRVEGDSNLTGNAADVGGTRVTFFAPFKDRPANAPTAYDMATGDRYEITGQDAEGFNIAFFNAAGARVTRTFDYVSQGYGVKQ